MSDWYYQTSTVGGDGGGEFAYLMSPVPIVQFIAWSDSNAIRSLEFVLPGGGRQNVGFARATMTSISFEPGEQITSLTMAKTDGKGTGGHVCLGQIRIRTNKGQDVTIGPGGMSQELSVASGLMVGWRGQASIAIDQLSFYFLQPVQSLKVTIDPEDAGWKGPVSGSQNTGIQQTVVAHYTFTNTLSEPLNWTFAGSQTVTNTNKFTQPATKAYGENVSVGVSAQLFDIGMNAANEFNWSLEQPTTQESSTSTTFEIGDTVSGQLAKGKSSTASTICQLGKLNINYTSTVQIVFKDPGIPQVSFAESGVFENAIHAYGDTTVA